MRKFLLPSIALIFALSFVLNYPATVNAQGAELVCSSPVDGATVEVLPETVSLTFSQDLAASGNILYVSNEKTSARVDVNGSEPTVDGATLTVELRTEVADDAPVALEAGATYEVLALAKTDGGLTRASLTFTVSADATEVGVADADCETTAEPTEEAVADATDAPTEEVAADATDAPTEEVAADATDEPTTEPTEEATEEPTAEPTEEPTVEPTIEPTVEPTEVPAPIVGEATSYAVGSANIDIAAPVDYVAETNEELFILPVTLFAKDADTIAAYLEDADQVQEFVVIFTSFTTADFASFGLEEGADNNAIIATLVRSDSSLGEQEEVTVADAPALAVSFANETSGKSGRFHLVQLEGGNYLLIQGSAPTADWETYAPIYDAVVASIAPTAE